MSPPPLRKWLSLKTLSLFEIISQCTLRNKHVNTRPFHRLCTLMRKMGAQSLWIDDFNPEIDSEIAYEINLLKKVLPETAEFKAYKLYFVKESVTERNGQNLSKLTFLSYSAIINYSSINKNDSYLLFSVVATPMKHDLYRNKAVPLTNYYFHTIRDYEFRFGSPEGNEFNFNIIGAPFFQKNSITSFCIQTALATLLNQADYRGTLLLPVQINELAGLSISQSTSGGLDIAQTINVIKNQGCFAKTFDFHLKDTDKLFKSLHKKFDLPPSGIIYPWMESGLPGFIVFVTKKDILHAVPIIGHTLNTDRWDPEADIRYRKNVRYHFRSVSAWVDNYIIHDDNFGMYLCYPTDKLEEKKRNYGYLVNYVLFMPKEEITYPPDKIEISLIAIMRNILDKFSGLTKEENPWLYKLKHELSAPLVSRTIACQKSNYVQNLKNPDCFNKIIADKLQRQIAAHLPESFWLTEITLPDLYVANKAVIINFISDLKNGDLLFFRFPKFCVMFKKGKPPEILELNTLGHFKLYSREHNIETFDW